MGFAKTCPRCSQDFISLVTYMSHIKNNHGKISPKEFVKDDGELKWSFRNDE
jgi:hypothetical protein